jgi:hypothetical protein
VVVDLRRWWLVLKWVLESECVRDNSIICDEGCEMECDEEEKKQRRSHFRLNRVLVFLSLSFGRRNREDEFLNCR